MLLNPTRATRLGFPARLPGTERDSAARVFRLLPIRIAAREVAVRWIGTLRSESEAA